MSIREVTMYQVVCDTCGTTRPDSMSRSDADGAATIALLFGWHIAEGKHYCPDDWPAEPEVIRETLAPQTDDPAAR